VGEVNSPRTTPLPVAGALAIAALIVGVLFRLHGAVTDLWFDEIWSLSLIENLPSPLGVFTIRHDNNHLLNSLWLYIVGPDAPALAYRAVALLASLVLLGIAASAWPLLGRPVEAKSGKPNLFFLVLVALSPQLTLLGTEARGYSVALCAGVAILTVLARSEIQPSTRAPWVVAGLAVLGLLSHLSFATVLAAIAFYALVVIRRRALVPGERRAFALAGAGLAAVVGTLYWFFVRGMVYGGGPPATPVDVFTRAIAYTLGLPETGVAGIAATAVAFALGASWLTRRWRERPALVVFWWMVTLVGPVAALLLTRPPVMAPRYFALPALFVLWAVAGALDELCRRGRRARLVAFALAGLLVAGATVEQIEFFRFGRGDPRGAIRVMRDRSGPGVIVVASDHDLRNFLLLRYFHDDVGPGQRLAYVRGGLSSEIAPRFFIVHHLDRKTPFLPALQHGTGEVLDLIGVFPHAHGFGWGLYQQRD
jgi:Predicted membrane protein